MDLPLEKLADAVAALRNEIWSRPEQERRALPRIRVWAPRTISLIDASPVGVTDSAPAVSAQPLEVWLVDLACGGVSFLSPRALEIGREFMLSLPVMDAAPVNLLCNVLHCQLASNGAYTVGGVFLHEITDSAPAEATGDASPDDALLRKAS